MTRLYRSDALFLNQTLSLTEAQSHYLRHVLRAKEGHRFMVFNERDGEWEASLTSTSRTGTAVIEKQHRLPVPGLDISLLFAPLKHDPLAFLIEKATELGVQHFYPVRTERCQISRVNEDRLRQNIIEASQQCERFDIPTLASLSPLRNTLSSWDAQIPLVICQERNGVHSISEVFKNFLPKTPISFLIGPEGGFTPSEMAYLATLNFVKFASLGPRILRAETAALAVLTAYQAILGDWG